MKKFLIFMLLGLSTQLLTAQSVGIGTGSPSASAALHVSSTSRGFLPPRMNSTQRNGIGSPLDGLIVYDTEVERLYVHQDGGWKFILNNDTWATNAAGTDVYNNNKNVGIGNAAPTERLHVSGNIRAAGSLLLTGEVVMNNPAGILQFQNLAVDKGYVQLSGNNLRMGTNGGNATGSVVFRLNAIDRVEIKPSGDINLDGRVTSTAVTGAAPLTPLCYGYVQADGSRTGTSNFTVQKIATGRYEIINPSITFTSVAVVTSLCPGFHTVSHIGGGGKLVAEIRNSSAVAIDCSFSIIVY
ncbi:MAG: hypothetical protein V4722_13275 [Bacteroidota bacterium]